MNARYEIQGLLGRTMGDIRLSRDVLLLWNARRDELMVHFLMIASETHDKKDVMTFEIESRDYEGIVSEIREAQTYAYTSTAVRLNAKLASGFIYG